MNKVKGDLIKKLSNSYIYIYENYNGVLRNLHFNYFNTVRIIADVKPLTNLFIINYLHSNGKIPFKWNIKSIN